MPWLLLIYFKCGTGSQATLTTTTLQPISVIEPLDYVHILTSGFFIIYIWDAYFVEPQKVGNNHSKYPWIEELNTPFAHAHTQIFFGANKLGIQTIDHDLNISKSWHMIFWGLKHPNLLDHISKQPATLAIHFMPPWYLGKKTWNHLILVIKHSNWCRDTKMGWIFSLVFYQ